MTKIGLILLLGAVSICCSAGDSKPVKSCGPAAGPNSIDIVLSQLKDQTEKLQSYQCKVEYLFRQPLFESQTLRKGVLYYAKFDDKSALRINFETLKQDDESEQKYKEQYIFDGVWLTHIDYQIKQIRRYQQTEPDAPLDAFELAKRNFPIIGFSRIEDLRGDFQISLVGQNKSQEKKLIRLHLTVKPDSVYKDDYTSIDFWIDTELNLPKKIVAVSTEEDIYEFLLLEPKTEQKLSSKIFQYHKPQGFEEQIEPLQNKKDKSD